MNKDIVWIDYAKVIGIWLVILGHSIQRMPGWEDSLLHAAWDWIYLFHMPLFFVISGYLYKGKRIEPLRTGGNRIWWSLVVPYLIYQVTFLPFAIWIHKEELLADGQWWKLLVGLIDGDGYDTPISMYICIPCWFIISIIQLRVLFLLVDINKISAAILAIISIIFLVIRKRLGFDLFFCIDCTIMAIPYFIIGYYMRKTSLFERIKEHRKLVAVTLLSAVVVSLVLLLNGPAQMIGPSYGHNVIANYIAGISGSFFVFSLSYMLANRFGESKEIKIVSRNTLFILFAHWVVLLPSGIIIAKVFCKCNNMIVLSLGALILSGIVLLIMIYWIEQWIEKYPVVFGKINKFK